MPTKLTDHFTLEELVSSKVNRDDCAVPFDQCVVNLTALCANVLEIIRSKTGPIGINSGLRDVTHNASLANDPASAARVKKRPGPHCGGESADIRILSIDKLSEPARSEAYVKVFEMIYKMAHEEGLPIQQAILEYSKGEAVPGKETGQRITHIHIQHKIGVPPSLNFVARKWKLLRGKLAESYLAWKP